MDIGNRIERALEVAIAHAEAPGAPPRLAEALRYAVFPGGARVRPRLCLSVARACGDDAPDLADATAAALELLHCASLVHDDLPCFDDADLRRGKPSVHAVFGEPLAVLAGDALIVLAFETVARAGAHRPDRLAGIITTITRAVGMPAGITAGQAWESEPHRHLENYHHAKTGALFVGGCVAGALAAGTDPAPWRQLGERLGEAYQVADDLRDAFSDSADLGKPVGQDRIHDRPSALRELGAKGCVGKLEDLVAGAVAAIPDCPGHAELKGLVLSEAKRLMPKKLARQAA